MSSVYIDKGQPNCHEFESLHDCWKETMFQYLNDSYANICCITISKFYVKNNVVYILAICTYFPCKIEKFELEAVGVDNLGTGFCFQDSH